MEDGKPRTQDGGIFCNGPKVFRRVPGVRKLGLAETGAGAVAALCGHDDVAMAARHRRGATTRKNAKKMQRRPCKKVRERSKTARKEIRAEGVSGSNSVRITLDGEGEIQTIQLSDEIMKEDKVVIEDLIIAAHNNAKAQLKLKTSEEISKATGSFGIPGFKWPL